MPDAETTLSILDSPVIESASTSIIIISTRIDLIKRHETERQRYQYHVVVHLVNDLQ